MLQTKSFWVFLALVVSIAAGCYGASQAGRCCPQPAVSAESEAGEVEVPVDQIPADVKAAAIAAVPGLVIEEAEREVENGIVVYDVEGTANGKAYEVEVTADGKVLEVELDTDDDDEHDDDKDDDKD